jgi:DNA-binding phage protein
MSNNEKSLQKLTDLEVVESFLSQKKLTMKGFWSLSEAQRDLFNEEANRRLNILKGESRDLLMAKLNTLLRKEDKNQLWQYNHSRIQATISNLLNKYDRMPTVEEISEKSELSRQTIYKHLKQFDRQKQFKDEWDKIRYASISIFATVAKYALQGDMKAAMLYFDILQNNQA